MARQLKLDNLPEDVKSQIMALSKQGYSDTYIKSWLEDLGYNIPSKTTVKNWVNKNLSCEYSDKVKRDMTPNPVIDTEQDLKKIMDNLNIFYIDLDDVGSVVGSVQKLTAKNFLFCQLIVASRLEKYSQGLAKFPSEHIRSLKELSEIFSRLYGVDNLVSIDSAIKSLEKYGYDVSGIIENVPK